MEEGQALLPWLLIFKVSHSGYLRVSQVRNDIIDTGGNIDVSQVHSLWHHRT